MSLLRLLAAGKSLRGMRDTESRYRLTSQRLLPHFGSGKNPFSSKEKEEPAPAEPRSPRECKPNGATKAIRNATALTGEREAALPSRPEGMTMPAHSHFHELGGVLRRRATVLMGEWRAKLERWRAKPNKVTKPAIPRFAKPPVQGELSLDRIRVVRNDLSDADLEIVPAKPPATPALRSVEKAAGAESAWGRVTARVLGDGKSDEDR